MQRVTTSSSLQVCPIKALPSKRARPPPVLPQPTRQGDSKHKVIVDPFPPGAVAIVRSQRVNCYLVVLSLADEHRRVRRRTCYLEPIALHKDLADAIRSRLGTDTVNASHDTALPP